MRRLEPHTRIVDAFIAGAFPNDATSTQLGSVDYQHHLRHYLKPRIVSYQEEAHNE